MDKVLTILIAAIVAYIGVQQYLLARERFKLDLFEKRFMVYAAAREFIRSILETSTVEIDKYKAYRNSVADAPFLFGDDVTTYLTMLSDKTQEIFRLSNEMGQTLSVEERNVLIQQERAALTWLVEHPVERVFAPYMTFSVWKGEGYLHRTQEMLGLCYSTLGRWGEKWLPPWRG